ncbi:MAG: Gfo/Idh/MocA family oxidoreductase [candidate division WOR-3 bacterium]
MKEQPVRIAVAGCGAQAQVAHIPALKQNRRAELVALCDTDIRKVNHLCTLYNVPRHYVDFDDLKADENVDAVVIATPNYLHAPMAIAAMEYGKDVLCETPFGLNADEASQMIATARREGRKLMPCLNTRLRPDVQTIRKFINGGELGQLYYCKTGWLQGRSSWSLEGWRAQRLRAGGGAFLSLGTALLDFSLWLLAPARPMSVIGVSHHRTPVTEVEDTAFAMIRLENDILLTVEVGWSMLMERDFTYFNGFGTQGAALLNPIQIHKEMHGHLVNVTPTMSTKGIQRASFQMLIDIWIDCLVRDVEPAIPASEALLINQVADAFYHSSSTRSEVQLATVSSGSG